MGDARDGRQAHRAERSLPAIPLVQEDQLNRRKGRGQDLLQIRARLGELEQSLLASAESGEPVREQSVEIERGSPSPHRSRNPGAAELLNVGSGTADAADRRPLERGSRGENEVRPAAVPDDESRYGNDARRSMSIRPANGESPLQPHVSSLIQRAAPPQISFPAEVASPTSVAESSVRISIGRIHVVAASPRKSRHQPPAVAAATQKYVMSLEEYLSRRAAGRTG
jgi:hypothetical protein